MVTGEAAAHVEHFQPDPVGGQRENGHQSLRYRPQQPLNSPDDVDATSTSFQRHGWDIYAL